MARISIILIAFSLISTWLLDSNINLYSIPFLSLAQYQKRKLHIEHKFGLFMNFLFFPGRAVMII